jgi:hypothetical protein
LLRNAPMVVVLMAAVPTVEGPTPATAAGIAVADVLLQRRGMAAVDIRLQVTAAVVDVRAAAEVVIPRPAADHPTAAVRRTEVAVVAADMGGNAGINYFPE